MAINATKFLYLDQDMIHYSKAQCDSKGNRILHLLEC